MTLTILVYLWMVLTDISLIATIASVLLVIIFGIAYGIAVDDENLYIGEKYKEGRVKAAKRFKACTIALCVSVLCLTLIPSKKQVAILAAAYTASTVVQSIEAQKAMELLRLYIGKELDAEIAKLKK